MSLNLNIYQTLAAAIVVYYIGVLLRVKISVLRKYCIPATGCRRHLICYHELYLIYQGIWKYEQGYDHAEYLHDALLHQRRLYGQHQPHQAWRHHVLNAIVTTILIICQNIIGSSLAIAF